MTMITMSPTLKAGGRAVSDRELNNLLSIKVERAFGLVGRATLRFEDVGYAISAGDTFKLGAEVAVGVYGGAELMTGQVTGVTLDQGASEHPELIVTVDDHGYRLALGNTVASFSNMSFTDVIRKIAGDAGLSANVSLPSNARRDYLLQTGSNLAFVAAAAERSGCVWWVDGKALNVRVADPATATVAKLSLTEDLLEFSVHASGLRPTEVKVSGWDPQKKQALVGVSSRQPTSQSNFVAAYAKPQSGLAGPAKFATADQSPVDAGEAGTTAQALFDDWAASAVVARGRCSVNDKLKPGSVVDVANAGPASGKYLITKVEHIFSTKGFFTKFTTGHNRPSGLVDTLSSPAPNAGFSVDGLVVAVVTDVRDPDKIGRVRVQYVGVSGEVASPWARVLSLGAGNNRGAVFTPEVNDEVLVGFENSETRRPVVLGGLFSKKDTPPWIPQDGASSINARSIMSRLGHVIELGDGADPATQHLLLKLKGGNKLRLGEDRFDIEVAAGKPLLIKAGQAKLEMDANGNVTIEGMNITIKAQQKLDLQGTTAASLKSNVQTSVEGAQVAVKGQATTSVEASGPLTLKGAVVAIN